MTEMDISWKTIFKIALVIILFYAIFLLKDIIGWIILALIISILINPLIDFLKINRAVASVIVYSALLLILGICMYFITPPLIVEIQDFGNTFGEYFKEVPAFLDQLGIDYSLKSFYNLGSQFNESLIKISSNIFNIFTGLFGSIFAGITIFTLALFFSIEKFDILKGIKIVTPKKLEEQVLDRWKKSQKHVVGWFGSRIISSIFIGVTTFIFCVILDIKFALIWGLLAGILNIVPMIGPVISGILIALFVLFDSIPKTIGVIVFSIIIQQIESNVLMPVLSKKFNGLSVSLVLISILVGGALWGLIGAILAIPVTGILFEILRDYFKNKD